MKTELILKWIDLAGQTAILVVLPSLTVASFAEEELPGALAGPMMMTGFFLGPWQMFSSLISILSTTEFRKEKSRHMVVALCYLVLMGAAPSVINTLPDVVVYPLVFIAFMVPAALAVYYYVITWRWALTTRHTGSFLRHISF